MEKQHRLLTKENFDLVQFILTPKVIYGALRSAAHAHGPIPVHCAECGHTALIGLSDNKIQVLVPQDDGTNKIQTLELCGAASAAKRIRGALKTRVEEYLERLEEKDSEKR